MKAKSKAMGVEQTAWPTHQGPVKEAAAILFCESYFHISLNNTYVVRGGDRIAIHSEVAGMDGARQGHFFPQLPVGIGAALLSALFLPNPRPGRTAHTQSLVASEESGHLAQSCSISTGCAWGDLWGRALPDALLLGLTPDFPRCSGTFKGGTAAPLPSLNPPSRIQGLLCFRRGSIFSQPASQTNPTLSFQSSPASMHVESQHSRLNRTWCYFISYMRKPRSWKYNMIMKIVREPGLQAIMTHVSLRVCAATQSVLSTGCDGAALTNQQTLGSRIEDSLRIDFNVHFIFLRKPGIQKFSNF